MPALGGGALEGPGLLRRPDGPGRRSDGAECSREEIFGPVVTVETFADEADAIARASDVPFGLAASLWTDDARRSHDVASRLDSGTVFPIGKNSKAQDFLTKKFVGGTLEACRTSWSSRMRPPPRRVLTR